MSCAASLPPLCHPQVSGLLRERTKLAILQEAVIVASTLSFAGELHLRRRQHCWNCKHKHLHASQTAACPDFK